MIEALRKHWPEYLIEAGALGAFMVSACSFAALLGHPESPAQNWMLSGMPMRMLMGAAMGLTAISIIYSPWGKRSGAHMNPVVTFTFWRLGKVETWDAFFYMLSQFIGGIGGVLLVHAALRSWVSHPAVNYAVTRPGRRRLGGCFLRGGGDLFSADVRDPGDFQHATIGAVHGAVRRRSGGDVYHFRIADFGNEHESGADAGVGFLGARLDSAMDLLYGAGAGDAAGGRAVREGARGKRRDLRQAAPPERATLHFSVRLRDEGEFAGWIGNLGCSLERAGILVFRCNERGLGRTTR